MNKAAIVEQAPGVLLLSGVLDHYSGPALREQGRALLGAGKAEHWQLDCSAVSKSSSVGLALLLALLRDAQAAGRTLGFKGLPKDMQEIARVCGLQELLPLAS